MAMQRRGHGKGGKMKTAQKHDCGERSYVGMLLCPICEEPLGIVLDGNLEKSLCKKNINPTQVCDDCREQYLTGGVMLISPKTGDLFVITDEGFDRTFTVPIPPGKIAFVSEDVIALLKRSYEEGQDDEPTE